MPDTERSEFTTRVLMTLVDDLRLLREAQKNIEAKIEALAKQYGVTIPKSDED